MIDCRVARDLIGPYIDEALDPEEAAAFAEHLRTCPDCARRVAAQQEWRRAIKRHAPRHAAPDGMRVRLAEALEAADAGSAGPVRTPPRTSGWRHSWRPWAMAASILVAVAASSGLTAYFTLPGTDDRLVQQLVGDHVRSLMADHLTDVASNDQHTVKPWFHGRVDLAPPVTDLAAEGYPLIGGRLDYLEQQPVAALVYRHAQHPINVFVLPNPSGQQQSLETTEQRGYNLLHWTRGDISFWAVSDLNLDELKQFQRLFEKSAEGAG